jgi:hypothetical protein
MVGGHENKSVVQLSDLFKMLNCGAYGVVELQKLAEGSFII